MATVEIHPTNLAESHVTHGALLGISEETHYKKRPLNVRDIETINKHLADAREAHAGKDEEPITADTVELHVDNKYHLKIRNMLRKHESLWAGQLGNINITEHSIDLVAGARPFKSAPYRAGPKSRELEQFEIDKRIKAGVIEPSTSEWAAPVLFGPKKDGRLRFCVDYRKLNTMTVKDSYPIPRMDE